MGSWHGTCMLSNTAITAGSEVVLYVLEKNKYPDEYLGGGFCYPNNYYEPLALGVVGEYDDYGGITNVVGDVTPLEKYFEDKDIRAKDDEGELFKNLERGNYEDYSFVLIHKELHDNLVKQVGKDKSYYTEGKTIRKYYEDKLTECLKKYKKEDSEGYYKFYTRADFCNMLNDTSPVFKDLLKDIDNKYLFNKIIDWVLIQRVVNTSRKFWFPQSGAGGNDQEYDVLRTISKFVAKQHREYLRECREY